MSRSSYDVAIIGGGIIGLATALALAERSPRQSLVVIEKEPELATHQTGHNSGVIHAGIYYSPGSQKASWCWRGAQLLRRFCDEHGIRYELCGKLILATTEEELPRLEELMRRGQANGVEGLEMVGPERIREIEPHATGVRALWSPYTGIVDYRQVARAYATEFQEGGGDLLTGAQVHAIHRRDGRLYLETGRGDIAVRYLINCAGLHADRVARMMGVDVGVRIIPFRGEYYTLRPEKAHLVRGLIYPVPDPRFPFLGVHFTKRISGSVEAGPNAVLALAREGYGKFTLDLRDLMETVTYPGFWRMSLTYWRTGLEEQYRSLVKAAFVRSLQKLVPEVRGEDLYAPGAGVRAQAVDRKGRLLQDFSIAETGDAVHVLNAPSPGATSSLAIGDYIVDLARRSFQLAA